MVGRDRRLLPRWRPGALAALLAVAVAVAPGPIGEAHTCTPSSEVGVGGRLLLPRGSGLAVMDLPGRALREVPIAPAQGVATAVAASPDGSLIAVTRFWRPPDHRVGGQDILLVGPAGGEPVASITRGQPGDALGSPAWLPDGSLVYERRTLSGVNEAVRVERARPGEPGQVLAGEASWPTVSPDGGLLAMVRSANANQLVVRVLDGGAERVVVDDPRLLSIAFPRFSPDGTWIAFTAAADPAQALAPAPGLPRAGSLVRLGPATARAHGVPWDVWLVRPDGSGLRRATQFYDDDSSVAWSPDGAWLVTFSAEALHVVAVDGVADYCLAGEGGYGGVEWLR